jgi:beta-phosphoglucomutase-like phosphatase (HAD superfamily)
MTSPHHEMPVAVLFDIDGTLITTGGAGGRAWHRAFERLFDVEVDIADFSESGQTDPEVAVGCFRGALGRDPDRRELTRLLGGYLDALPDEVASSPGYRVLPASSICSRTCATRASSSGSRPAT